MVKFKGCPSCMNTILIPMPEAPHSKTKVPTKFGTINTRVLHMGFFKVDKDFSTTFLDIKESYFSNKVKGP